MGKRGAKRPPLSKFCHKYPTIMKLGTLIFYLKKIQNIYKITWHTPWLLLTSAVFYWKSENFAILRNTNIECILMYFNSFNFFWVLNNFLINVVTILMSAKMSTLGLLKIKVFWNKGYDIIISVYDVINKNLSRDSNFIVDVVMWAKFNNSRTSMREVMIISIL